MCLNALKKHPYNTNFMPITVYKLLYKSNITGKYTAPYVGGIPAFEYKRGMNKPKTLKKQCNKVLYDTLNQAYVVKGGWLHAFTKASDAERVCEIQNRNINKSFGEYVVVEMTVPSWTRFYLSINELEICSKKLKWEE